MLSLQIILMMKVRPAQPGNENENETDTRVSFCKKSTARPNLFHENENETDTQHAKFCRIFEFRHNTNNNKATTHSIVLHIREG